ncbi:hypothetical protein HII31_09570 [Pseudocercospora fuligena]|uniref:Uncharacterized protein n=1 Tax=Pseudocercospora fuligena TaxID=685502 RepID=A0A8H6VEA4_9PEZI|nr:hypothetical protein HII31_09570 [Pseudocercospora fuligena]
MSQHAGNTQQDPLSEGVSVSQPLLDAPTSTSPSTSSPNRGNPSLTSGPSSNAGSSSISDPARKISMPRTGRFGTWPWLKLWSWEILSTIFSLLCIFAVVGILAAMDGKSLDEWKLPISPNSLVSVFITLSKSALLLMVAEGISQLKWTYFAERRRRLYDLQIFDDASRGPWGAGILLLSIRHKALIASVGALITVISMAMDPFAQQIIEYNTVSRNRTGVVAHLRSARHYSNGYDSIDANSGRQLPDYSGQIATAILGGLSGSILPTSFSCDTGNCTWPTVDNLAICNQCINISETANAVCDALDSGEVIDFQSGLSATLPPTTLYGWKQSCTVSSPQTKGLSLNIWRNLRGYKDVWENGTSSLSSLYSVRESRMNITAQSNCSDCFQQGNVARILAVFPDPLGLTDVLASHPRSWPTKVYECSLDLCTKQYRTSVMNGNLSETLLKTDRLEFPSCLGYIPWNSPLADSVCPGFVRGQVPPNMNSTTLDSMAEDPTSYAVSRGSVDLVKEQFINTTVQTATSISEALDEAEGSNIIPVLLFYANGKNFSKTMDNIAASMSHQVRHNMNATWVAGWTQEPTTRVRVIWLWSTLPIALVFMSIAFLCTAMIVSAQPARHVWKSSILGVAFHRIEGSTPDELDQRELPEWRRWLKKSMLFLRTTRMGGYRCVVHALLQVHDLD